MFRSRQYGIELGAALALYSCLILIGVGSTQWFHPEGVLRSALCMAPLIGAVAVAWVILRALGRMDELQRRVQFEAIAIAFLGTALVTIGWSFAEIGGAPHLRAALIWPGMGLLWIAGMIYARWKYR
ncbi:hypothetical protein HW537_11850 [Asaia siamensis]